MLVGFDIRFGGRSWINRCWSETRRRRFLIRSDVDWPASVDRVVWPSVFQEQNLSGSTDRGWRETLPSIGLPSDAAALTDLALWNDLSEMEGWYRSQTRSWDETDISIAAQVLLEPNQVLGGPLFSISKAIETLVSRRSVTTLGFDVADANLTSALSNCALRDDEVEDFRITWRDRINSLGLLQQLEHAVQFRRLADDSVPEHRPFYVFELRRID